MNIHEHQAKELLKQYGAPVSNGFVVFDPNEIKNKIKDLKSEKYVLKAQIHAGGRGKAGGVKLVKNFDELNSEARKMFGKILITKQTFFFKKKGCLYANFQCVGSPRSLGRIRYYEKN